MTPYFQPRFSISFTLPNPLWWIKAYWYAVKERYWPTTYHCDNCGADIGKSLWGWCSVECLKALAEKAKHGEHA